MRRRAPVSVSMAVDVRPEEREDPAKLFISGLPMNVTESFVFFGCFFYCLVCLDELRRHFSRFGTVSEVLVPVNKHTARPRGFAFLRYASMKERENAVVAGDHFICGFRVSVERALPLVPGQRW